MFNLIVQSVPYPLNSCGAVIAGTKDKPHGHIHIYHSGNKKWYSDFGANTVYCYKDKGRPYIVYRWKKGGYNQDA